MSGGPQTPGVLEPVEHTRRARRPNPKLWPPVGIWGPDEMEAGPTSRVRPHTGIKKQMAGMARGLGFTITSPANCHMLSFVERMQKNLWVRRQEM